ncbi:MAG: DEAD/DEAH box helicase family protein [Gemmatimonadaceae bacterium]|nr:DEAD/DEAH box helicase family protein [Gemmatimonadaceae bacterium]
MKLHFEPDLDYQRNAIDAVTGLFRGQEIAPLEFTVSGRPTAEQIGIAGMVENELGIGNRLSLLDDELHANLKAIQLRNGLRPSERLDSGDFTVEMETGTGKTYVYLRTIFELHRLYGFTKFVIVVPSVAIKEGVYKTIQITEAHFRALYANTPFEYFVYDSAKLGQVRNFATSAKVQLMVVTVGAINKKDVNNLYKESEKVGGEKPIELIKATRPIIIVDEPQSVDGGLQGSGKAALDAMNALCTLRYSATHVDKHHMVYRLDAVDAYERRLVKQIEVAAAEVAGGFNKPYLRFISASSKKGGVSARVELDLQQGGKVVRKEIAVFDGDDLEQVTGRELYRDHRIGEIRAGGGNATLEVRLPGDERWLAPGEAIADVDPDAVQRQMIRRTIKEHLQKELRLAPLGIKVLSLFFIDKVDNYRQYDHDGTAVKGKYARMFEEEYRALAKDPSFSSLFKEVDVTSAAAEVHEGYFSIDRKKVGGKQVDVLKDTRGDSKADDDTYNLIMRDKEKLLSFNTKLKFIFSHSALREGWDNPNVFQICTLRDIGTEQERRQSIGRGLRLCVNQNGERVRGFEVNTLTVIANEPFEEFADNLQKEIEADTGIRFGILEDHQFALVEVVDADGNASRLGLDQSRVLWEHFKTAGLIDAKGRVQDAMRTALLEGKVTVPSAFTDQLPQIRDVLRKVAGRLQVKNADERVTIRPRQGIVDGDEFRALWDRIKHKTTYRVHFDNESLIEQCVKALRDAPPVTRTRMVFRKGEVQIGRGGVVATEKSSSGPIAIDERDIELPDVITDLQDRTQLTRRSIVRILRESGRLADFRRNPQEFIEFAAEAINKCKRLALVDGIKYQRIGDQEFYAQELFQQEELTGYLKQSLETRKSVYERVVYDSAGVERAFAEAMEQNEAVKVYAKLPGWFRVPTPLGSYNPDWAVVVQREGEAERLYFVVETKGSLFAQDLRVLEGAKIECGRRHFEALAVMEGAVRYVVATGLEGVLA